MLRDGAARRGRVEDRLVLERVQMPPLALRLVVVQRAHCAALRTGPLQVYRMTGKDMHLSDLQLQVNSLYLPRVGDPQNPGSQCFHADEHAARIGP